MQFATKIREEFNSFRCDSFQIQCHKKKKKKKKKKKSIFRFFFSL